MDHARVAEIFDRLNREVWLITAAAGPRRGGLIATFVSPASIVPELPRVVVGLARHHHTHDLVEAGGAFALHLLGEHQLDLVWRFGLRSGRDVDKLADLPCREGSTGVPILEDVPGWLECRVEARLSTGDRTLFLAEVVDGGRGDGWPTLTAPRLRELAPAERLRELREQLHHDAAVDAVAIRDWRRGREASGGPSPG
jgi:flavin reductase (DIM6/NTAB) family NADH-FMN oxidoreductase RutF